MPLLCPGGFDTCATSLEAREIFRKNNTDVSVYFLCFSSLYGLMLYSISQDASPGYFSLTLDNEIQMEATSTRRAGLERFTFPKKSKPYFVLDLANDLPGSFAGGTMNIDPDNGRITLGGLWGSRYCLSSMSLLLQSYGVWMHSWGPGRFNYQAFACYDLLNGGNQTLDEFGVWTADTLVLCYIPPYLQLTLRRRNGLDAKGLGLTQLNFTRNLIGGVYQSGALFSFKNEPQEVTIRVGISFKSAEQACSNAETEVGDSSFDEIVAQSKALWNEKLSKIELDMVNTPRNVTEMLYSSLYRSFLTPVHLFT